MVGFEVRSRLDRASMFYEAYGQEMPLKSHCFLSTAVIF